MPRRKFRKLEKHKISLFNPEDKLNLAEYKIALEELRLLRACKRLARKRRVDYIV
ncbi:MAG: hypothetical protein QXX79_02870 [Candidatus Bathyarchaeia archaeon]